MEFRRAVFERDGHCCVICGRSGIALDAHHITDRHDMPNGGYVAENGVTLCDEPAGGCHLKAEGGEAGFLPDELYARIGSSFEQAWAASLALEEGSSDGQREHS